MIYFLLQITINICIYALLWYAYQATYGFTWMPHFWVVGLYALGAYVFALTSDAWYGFGVACMASIIITIVFNFMIAFVIRKLPAHVVSIVTFGIWFLIIGAILHFDTITWGDKGVLYAPWLIIMWYKTSDLVVVASMIITITTMIVLLFQRVMKSSFGKICIAIKNDRVALLSLWKNVSKVQYTMQCIVAFLSAVSWIFLVYYTRYIDPTLFDMSNLVIIITIAVLWGSTSVRGVLLATCIVVILPELVRFIPLPSEYIWPLRNSIYAILLLVVLYKAPRWLFASKI